MTPSWWWRMSSASCARKGLPPREATLRSMSEITGAADRHRPGVDGGVPADGVFRGSTGVIYRQILDHHRLGDAAFHHVRPGVDAGAVRHPAAALLRGPRGQGLLARFFKWFNRTFDQMRDAYGHGLARVLNHRRLMLAGYAGDRGASGRAVLPATLGLFLPGEDQGFVISLINLPSGATQDRTMTVADQVGNYFLTKGKEKCGFRLHRGGLQLCRRRPECGHRIHALERLGQAPRQGKQRRRRCPTRFLCIS